MSAKIDLGRPVSEYGRGNRRIRNASPMGVLIGPFRDFKSTDGPGWMMCRRVQALFARQGLLVLDPVNDLQFSLGLLGTEDVRRMFLTAFARADFAVDLSASVDDVKGARAEHADSEELPFFASMVNEAQRLGVTVLRWPAYGMEGPPVNPRHMTPAEHSAIAQAVSWIGIRERLVPTESQYVNQCMTEATRAAQPEDYAGVNGCPARPHQRTA